MKLSRTLIPTFILGLFAVLAIGSVFAAELNKAAKELAKLDDEWSACSVKKDFDALASYYADDARVYPPNEAIVVGREAAKKMWATALADPSVSLSWKTVTAEVAKSGDFGVTAGTYLLSFKGADGKMVTEHGKYLCVWKKDAQGKWNSIHDTWNSDSK